MHLNWYNCSTLCTLAGYHVWFAGMPEVLKHFQEALFHAADPTSGDAARFLYTLLLTLPSVRKYQWGAVCLVTGATRGVLTPRTLLSRHP